VAPDLLSSLTSLINASSSAQCPMLVGPGSVEALGPRLADNLPGGQLLVAWTP
jgi:hypothetical protein